MAMGLQLSPRTQNSRMWLVRDWKRVPVMFWSWTFSTDVVSAWNLRGLIAVSRLGIVCFKMTKISVNIMWHHPQKSNCCHYHIVTLFNSISHRGDAAYFHLWNLYRSLGTLPVFQSEESGSKFIFSFQNGQCEYFPMWRSNQQDNIVYADQVFVVLIPIQVI